LGDAHGSVVSNYDDHGFLLSCGAKSAPSLCRLRECFAPAGWLGDLRKAIEGTELLGRKFRPIAETAHLMDRRKTGGAARRQSSWNGSLLYQTFLKHEPDHPLVREAVREVLEDELDGERAAAEAKRIFESPWESFELDKPSPFSLTMFASHNREVLLAQDPDKALDELVMDLYQQW